MKKRIKQKMIGHLMLSPKYIKSEYLSKKIKKHALFVFVEIYKDKQYGAVARLYERNSLFARFNETTTKVERKIMSKSIAKMKLDYKPANTSKWVKPDEASIKTALVESLFALEILDEKSILYEFYRGKAKAFYSILHGHSPKNPQTLVNFSIDPYFEYIMRELRAPVTTKWRKELADGLKKDIKVKAKKLTWGQRQKEYKLWTAKCLKNMIRVDTKPAKYRDFSRRFVKMKKQLKTMEIKK